MNLFSSGPVYGFQADGLTLPGFKLSAPSARAEILLTSGSGAATPLAALIDLKSMQHAPQLSNRCLQQTMAPFSNM